MKLTHSEADIFVPDGRALPEALARVTHLAIGAHADDLEIMAHRAIAQCHENPDTMGFAGVVVTDGAGSARTGPYADRSNEEMKAIRREEQRAAARLGRYAVQFQLAHPSVAVKSAGAAEPVVADLRAILAATRPRELLVHNPADKHDTHVGVWWRCWEALRALPVAERPERVLGVEVWRGLDWVLAGEKVALDDAALPELRRELLAVFDSQITGGKRYDLAVEGRRAANATFDDSHAIDASDRVTWALDLTPLVRDEAASPEAFVLGHIDRLRADVADRLGRLR